MDRAWRDTQPTVASAAAYAENLERQPQETAAGQDPEPVDPTLGAHQKAARTMARVRRDRQERLREQREAREQLLRDQIEDGSLRVRHATGDELQAMRADAEQYREQHPEDAEKAARLRRSRPVVQPKTREPRTCALEDCGQEFTPSKTQKYCSSICANRAAWKLRKARAAA
jgi:hypothetical protein